MIEHQYLEAESLQQSVSWERFLGVVGTPTKRHQGVLWQHKTTPLPGIDFWYSPRCALSEDWTPPAKATFLRIEPKDTYSLFQLQKLAAKRGWKVILTKPQQPPQTGVIDIRPPLEALLPQWKSRHRQNFNRAEREGLTVEVHHEFTEAVFERFIHLHHFTADRNTFRPHPDSYYRTQLEQLMPAGALHLILISHEGVDTDVMMLATHDGVGATFHRGTAPGDRQTRSAYLLQASTIRAAQAAGCSWLDCWGINVKFNQEEQKWEPAANPASEGATYFKLGFAPEVVTYPGCFDVVLQPAKYALYQAALAIRGGKRSSGYFS